MPPKSTLRALVKVISDAVDNFEDKYASVGLEPPLLDDLFIPSTPSESLLFQAEIAQQASIIVAACEQLCVSVRAPHSVILETALSFHKTSCIYTAMIGNVPEILRETGSKGLHVTEIAAKNGMDAAKLSRVLRLLATYHIFTELSPDVFTNNRFSSAIDTGKPSSELSTPPSGDKYIGSDGLAALVAVLSDQVMTAGSYVPEFVIDNKLNEDPDAEYIDSPFKRAFNEDFFDWVYKPGNEECAKRFSVAMKGADPSEAILRGFPWDSLPAGSKIVDVGGGFGFASLTIHRKYPELKFVVEDLPETIVQAEKFWRAESPQSIASGSVVIQNVDFFQQQPVKDADIFLAKIVIHDWPTSKAIKILKRLREAAVPGKTRLVMIDCVIPYACKTRVDSPVEIRSSVSSAVPGPLLSNLGRASCIPYLFDIAMLTLLDGEERTIDKHLYITKESGWKITRVYVTAASETQHIIAEAV